MSKMKKIETLEEFLARGGSVKKLEEVKRDPQVSAIRTQAGGPAILLTLDDGGLLYGEPGKLKKVKKTKSVPRIDLDALPPALRSKFIAKLKEEADVEGYEKELEEIEDDSEEDSDEEIEE